MATGTFTYNALRTKTLKERIKTQRKIASHSISTRAMLLGAMLLVSERLPLNHIFPYMYAQWARISLVRKVQPPSFFLWWIDVCFASGWLTKRDEVFVDKQGYVGLVN